MLNKINEQLKQALRDKDDLKLSVLRQLKTALDNEAIAQKKKDKGLDEAETLKVIKREANKRKDAIAAFTDGGRTEMANNEKKELVLLEEYLPEQMSAEDLGKIVDEVIAKIKPSGPQDFGKVMGSVMAKIGAQADGNVVKNIIQEKIKDS
jgi:uncharacterized protein